MKITLIKSKTFSFSKYPYFHLSFLSLSHREMGLFVNSPTLFSYSFYSSKPCIITTSFLNNFLIFTNFLSSQLQSFFNDFHPVKKAYLPTFYYFTYYLFLIHGKLLKGVTSSHWACSGLYSKTLSKVSRDLNAKFNSSFSIQNLLEFFFKNFLTLI